MVLTERHNVVHLSHMLIFYTACNVKFSTGQKFMLAVYAFGVMQTLSKVLANRVQTFEG